MLYIIFFGLAAFFKVVLLRMPMYVLVLLCAGLGKIVQSKAKPAWACTGGCGVCA